MILFLFRAKWKADQFHALQNVRDQVWMITEPFPEMFHPEDSLELRAQEQGSFDFGFRGCPIAKLSLGPGRELAGEPKVRQK